jgi:hypothetical protein
MPNKCRFVSAGLERKKNLGMVDMNKGRGRGFLIKGHFLIKGPVHRISTATELKSCRP